jgi:ABC-2 type transport system ATP-binding protein
VLALDEPATLQASLPGRMLSIHADRPRAARDALRDAPFVRSAHLFGDSLHVHLATGTGDDEARTVLDAAGVGFDDVEPVTPSLEDVFMSLLRHPARADRGRNSGRSHG